MSYSLSPYDTPSSMSSHMPTSHLVRRTSRSSGSQSSHPYRVEKPRSNHNSPRTVERRKTTTGTKLYATLDDHYNMMMGLTGDEEVVEPESAPARPMSWHPSSTQFNTQPRTAAYEPTQPQDWSRYYSPSTRNSTHGSDFYSLSTRNSMYAEQHRGSQDSDASYQTQPYALSSFSTPATEPIPWYLQEWARKNQEQTMNPQHESTDFLPVQNPAMEQDTNAADEDMEDSGKELVGMGLYDLPDSALGWGSSWVEATGKGLKLEETWQPPEEEDDEDAEEVDDASSDDGEDELPPPPPAQQESEQLRVPVSIKPQLTPGSMEGQSFFFDEDDTVTKEWWFQHLKQPSLPVRDAGIGYGWL